VRRWGLAALLLLGALALGACSDPADDPPDRIQVSVLPLAPGFEVRADVEQCAEGTPGETNGSCAHMLAITGPAGLSEPQLVAREIEALGADWTSQGPGVVAYFDSNDCEATVSLTTAEKELRSIGPRVDATGFELAPSVAEYRAALVRLSAKGAVMAARLTPEDHDTCVAPGGGAEGALDD
jgi:hypothetical protein